MASFAIAAAASRPARSQSLDDLYTVAKSEGAFSFYVGGPTAPWEARAKVFQERYPGIKINVGGGFSNANDYRTFLTNQTQVAELRKRFETYSAPIVSSGGVR